MAEGWSRSPGGGGHCWSPQQSQGTKVAAAWLLEVSHMGEKGRGRHS